jgi:drug/metabolite transporter (DMT)-like permease
VIRLVLVFVLMVSCTVIGNILLKQGAMVAPSSRILFGVMGWRSAVGFAVFLMAGLLYSWLLRSVPLNVAQSFGSIQFVAVILASAVYLAEPIPPARLYGIAFIFLGITIVGFSSFGPSQLRRPADPTEDAVALKSSTAT